MSTAMKEVFNHAIYLFNVVLLVLFLFYNFNSSKPNGLANLFRLLLWVFTHSPPCLQQKNVSIFAIIKCRWPHLALPNQVSIGKIKECSNFLLF